MFLSRANGGAHKGAVVQINKTYGHAANRAHGANVVPRSLTVGEQA
jgi:hypothetical protein